MSIRVIVREFTMVIDVVTLVIVFLIFDFWQLQ